MKTKNEPCGTEEIIIPELEEAALKYTRRQRIWTQREIDTVEKYYGRVPVTILATNLHRSVTSVQQIASRYGFAHREERA